jgi:peptidoglycan/LPS O-acetylase OafA/YrhL
LPALDGFRALSILAVLAAHMLPLGPREWQFNSMAGYMGMSVFFALSGFLITQFLWSNQNIKSFLIRRFARIAPLVLLVSFLYALLFEGRADSFIATNLYVLNYWHSAIVPSISPLWSLGVEMHFYLGIALCVGILGRAGFFLVPVVAIIVTAMQINAGTFGSIITHFRVDEILSGAFLAILWMERERPISQRLFSAMRILFWPLVMLWMLSCWPIAHEFGYMRAYFTAAMIGSVLSMSSGWQQDFLSHGVLRYIATISFALYVWHSPFRHYWFDSGTDLERYLFKRPLAFICIFSLAHVSTFWFEKPITDAARRFTQRSRL